MGLIYSLLKSKDAGDVFLDLENATPTSKEMKTYEVVQKTLSRGAELMSALEDYKGCQELARLAMGAKPDEREAKETAAFEGLLTAVHSISMFFKFSQELEQCLPDLLTTLAMPPSDENKQSLADQQALAKQLADIFDFTLRFDQVRMQRPSLSNDFSYYRRLLPKFSKHPSIEVKEDDASGMALFTAEHIPMMSCLAKAGGRALERNEHVTTALAVMANSCMQMIKSKKFPKPETNLFAARAMTGSIILFDHVHRLGAFHSKTPIQIKNCVLLLKKEFPRELALMNAIHYSTKNFRTAPAAIQALFD